MYFSAFGFISGVSPSNKDKYQLLNLPRSVSVSVDALFMFFALKSGNANFLFPLFPLSVVVGKVTSYSCPILSSQSMVFPSFSESQENNSSQLCFKDLESCSRRTGDFLLPLIKLSPSCLGSVVSLLKSRGIFMNAVNILKQLPDNFCLENQIV